MYRFPRRISSRLVIASAFAAATLTAAGAATFHRLAVMQGTGSGGATNFLQSSTSASALEGNVGSADTGIAIPFGVLGAIDTSSSAPLGVGVLGISTTGYAVAAQTLNNQPSILAYPGGNGVGLEATTPTSSTAASIYAESKGSGDGADIYADKTGTAVTAGSSGGGEGILGYSNESVGVEGDSYSSSSSYPGVMGYSEGGNGVSGSVSNGNSGVAGNNEGSGFGVFAHNSSPASPVPNAAPYAEAGSYGQSDTGPGVYGVSAADGSAFGYGSQRGAGVFGFGNAGPGVVGYSKTDFGVYAQNKGNLPTLLIENETGVGETGIAFYAFNDATEDITIAYSNGNFYTDGSITSGSDTYQAVTRNPATDAMTYSAQQTEATVEDVGHAQLVNGSVAVPIASDFRQTINADVPYDVFLTPYGDTRGLYVASRSPSGFVVRETQGGRSSLAFSYRVVAQPYGARQARLPHLHDRITLPKRPRRSDMQTRSTLESNGTSPTEVLDPAHTPAQIAARARNGHRGAPPPIPANLFKH